MATEASVLRPTVRTAIVHKIIFFILFLSLCPIAQAREGHNPFKKLEEQSVIESLNHFYFSTRRHSNCDSTKDDLMAQLQHIENVCKNLKTAVEQQQSEKKTGSIGQEIGRKMTANTRVVLIGEDHNNQAGIRSYPELLADLKKENPKLDCLWMERDHGGQIYADQYLEGKITKAQYKLKMRQKRYSFMLPDTDNISKAKAMGLKVIYSDENIREEHTKNGRNFDAIMNDPKYSQSEIFRVKSRNYHMARFITESLNNNTCTAGVLIVGFGHFEEELGQSSTIQDILKSEGFNTVMAIGLDGATHGRIVFGSVLNSCSAKNITAAQSKDKFITPNDPRFKAIIQSNPEMKVSEDPMIDADFIFFSNLNPPSAKKAPR